MILWVVFAYGYMEENDVKSICGGTKLEFKIQKDEKNWIKVWRAESFWLKIRRVVFFSIQNLARCFFCQNQNPTPCVFLQTQNMIKSCCQNLADLSYALSASKNNLFETDNDWDQKAFLMSVWHLFVSHLLSFFAYCFLYDNWTLDGCDYFIICTTNWFIQICLEFK